MDADLPVACTLPEGERRERERTLQAVLAAARDVEELPDGVALRFGGDGERLRELVGLMVAERGCCRFLRFRLEAEPDLGPIFLTVTGPPGTRELVRGWLEG